MDEQAPSFVRIFRYDPDRDPSARLRLEYDVTFGNAVLSDENVLPEQAENHNARHIKSLANVDLTTAQVRWLAKEAAELADLMEANDTRIQAELDARKAGSQP